MDLKDVRADVPYFTSLISTIVIFADDTLSIATTDSIIEVTTLQQRVDHKVANWTCENCILV